MEFPSIVVRMDKMIQDQQGIMHLSSVDGMATLDTELMAEHVSQSLLDHWDNRSPVSRAIDFKDYNIRVRYDIRYFQKAAEEPLFHIFTQNAVKQFLSFCTSSGATAMPHRHSRADPFCASVRQPYSFCTDEKLASHSNMDSWSSARRSGVIVTVATWGSSRPKSQVTSVIGGNHLKKSCSPFQRLRSREARRSRLPAHCLPSLDDWTQTFRHNAAHK
jgi:hypothetical protein